MPQMDELAARLNVSKDELMDAVMDTGYELVPTAGPADPAGVAGMGEEMPMEEPMGEEGPPGRSLDEILGMVEGPGDEGPMDTVVEEEEEVKEKGPINIRALTMDVSKRQMAKGKKGNKDEESS